MFVLTLISIILALVLLDLITKPRLEEISSGSNVRSSAMSEIEYPGYDWLGKWW